MLHIQELLRNDPNGLDVIKNELGINVYRHPELPLLGFKYSQIDSPKGHPVVKESRGLVLEDGSFDIVAKGFNRFFNLGEMSEEFAAFNWEDFSCNSKEDGSLTLLHHYADEWRVNTSGSFGLGQCYFSGKTWTELFWDTSKIDRDQLIPGFTYVFELCTPWNQVVRKYPEPKVFLLSAFQGENESSLEEADRIADRLNVPRPIVYHFTSREEIGEFLIGQEDQDPTFEGVVIRDNNNMRAKLKSRTYVAYSHLKDNGNIGNPKRIVPLVLAGEADEVIALFPEFEERINEVSEELDRQWTTLRDLWRANKDIEVQKDFALSIRQHRFANLLFNIRRKYGVDQTEEHLRLEWRSDPESIAKKLYY